MEIITHKRCNHCMTVKPVSEFYARPERGGKPASDCRVCSSAKKCAREKAKRKGVIAAPKPLDHSWPLPAEADLTVQLLHLYTRRAYGAVPGVLMGRI